VVGGVEVVGRVHGPVRAELKGGEVRELDWEEFRVQLNMWEGVNGVTVFPPVPGCIEIVVIVTDLDFLRECVDALPGDDDVLTLMHECP
jgi:hypothetical protein